MQTLIGETVGRYKIVAELGRGGLAVVYRAIDNLLERSVALKMILPGQQQSEQFLRRFQREAKTLAQLSHSNIVKVLDYGEYQGVPFLVMEFIPGGTLADRMAQPMAAGEAAALLVPVAQALSHAHQRKVVHRDIKPANILINESGQPMLSDFGIAKLTETDESQSLTGTGVLIGTPAYMAPEQIQGRPVDGRTDVYALGIVLFELVTGRRPYTANTPIELTLKHLHEPVPRPRQYARDLPPEVEQAIMKAMAKKPEDRFQDMQAFAAALAKLAAGYTIPSASGWRTAESRPATRSAAHGSSGGCGKPDGLISTAAASETTAGPGMTATRSISRRTFNRWLAVGLGGAGVTAVGVIAKVVYDSFAAPTASHPEFNPLNSTPNRWAFGNRCASCQFSTAQPYLHLDP
jgi:eukaryotic-like serine/threonine-protein kinase